MACSTSNFNDNVASSAGFNTIYWQISIGAYFFGPPCMLLHGQTVFYLNLLYIADSNISWHDYALQYYRRPTTSSSVECATKCSRCRGCWLVIYVVMTTSNAICAQSAARVSTTLLTSNDTLGHTQVSHAMSVWHCIIYNTCKHSCNYLFFNNRCKWEKSRSGTKYRGVWQVKPAQLLGAT